MASREIEVVVGEQQFLIEVPAVGDAPVAPPGAAVGKVFRAYEPGQTMLLPPSLDEWLLGEHLARFIDELVEQYLDLEPFCAAHTNVKGFPPCDTRNRLLCGGCAHDLVEYSHLAGMPDDGL
jgi:hypothetical protein